MGRGVNVWGTIQFLPTGVEGRVTSGFTRSDDVTNSSGVLWYRSGKSGGDLGPSVNVILEKGVLISLVS